MADINRIDLRVGQTPTDQDWEDWLNRAIDYLNSGIQPEDLVKDPSGKVAVSITGDAATVGGLTAAQIAGGDFPDIKKTMIDLLSGGPFVSAGCAATKNAITQNRLDVTAGTVIQKVSATGYIDRVDLPATNKTTSIPNTSYYLDVTPGATDFTWGTAHPAGNYATIATITTDAAGNIATVTDTRKTTTNLLAGIQLDTSNLKDRSVSLVKMANKIDFFRVISAGSGATPPVPAGVLQNNNRIYTTARSFGVTVINRATHIVESNTTYDVFASPTPTNIASNMAAALNGLGSDKIVIVTTYDEPFQMRLTAGLNDALVRCGASRKVYEAKAFPYRGAYILIGIPGMGEGTGIEQIARYGNEARAWVETTVMIQDGNIVALQGKDPEIATSGYAKTIYSWMSYPSNTSVYNTVNNMAWTWLEQIYIDANLYPPGTQIRLVSTGYVSGGTTTLAINYNSVFTSGVGTQLGQSGVTRTSWGMDATAWITLPGTGYYTMTINNNGGWYYYFGYNIYFELRQP